MPVKIGGRAFDLLAALVDHAGDPVLKEELIARAWPNVFVHEAGVKVHVSMLRRILGDTASPATYIATIPGRGYQFIARVTRRSGHLAEFPVQSTRQRLPEAASFIDRKTAFGEVVALPQRGPRSAGLWSTQTSDAPTQPSQPRRLGNSTNLPAAINDLIGRAASLKYLQATCSIGRIVTLTGPGGIGKTTLAIELARSLLPVFDGGVWLVELASLADPNLVPVAVAEAIGLLAGGGPVSAEGVARAIGQGRVLLILDNCEHLIGVTTQLAETVVRLAPNAVILATSRETLRTHGERVYRVPSLDVPRQDSDETGTILGNSAVQLFLDRSEASQHGDLRSEQNLRLIARICRHLDGIPLAIEFAAARASSLGLSRVASSLVDRFGLLTAGRRNALPRHRTLRAVLDWSYALLPETERLLLHRLAIFPGTFEFEAACAVMPDHSPTEVADCIVNLVEKSIVIFDRPTPDERWRLLETVRAYALDKLAASGELDAVARAHAEYFRDFFAKFNPNADLEVSSDELPGYGREVDNLRAALSWAFSISGDPALGIALAAGSVTFWLAASLLDECRDWTSKALAELDDIGDGEHEMVLRSGLSQSLLFSEGLTPTTHANLTAALAVAEARGSIEYQKRAVHGLWQFSLRSVELRKALQLSRRYAEFAQSDNDSAATYTASLMVGMSLTYLAEYVEAGSLLEQAIHDYPAAQRHQNMAWLGTDAPSSAFGHLSTCLLARGRVKEAAWAAERSIEEARQVGQPVALCLALARPAGLLFPEIGDFETAERHIAAIMELADRHALPTFRALAVCASGRILFLRGDAASGAAALRSGLAQFEATGYRSFQTIFRGYYAEAVTAAGHADEGFAEIETAVRFAEQTEYMRFVPELLCIHGSLIGRHRPGNPVAEQTLRRAIDLARKQEALYWELRATLSMAESWHDQDRQAEAHGLLTPIHARFTEGLTTPVLMRAKALLTAIEGRV
jgi:non-specific serine/threonine protein kinase